jgi:hypothetical protein
LEFNNIDVEVKVNTLSHDYFGLKSESKNQKVSLFFVKCGAERWMLRGKMRELQRGVKRKMERE